MSILFDQTQDWYSVADSADLVLPSTGRWCVGIWTKVTDIAGEAFQYVISQGGLDVNGLHLYLAEAGVDGWAGRFLVNLQDEEGRRLDLASAAYGADGIDRLFVLQEVVGAPTSVKQLWSCPAGGAAVLEDSTFDPLSELDAAGDLNIGRRADGNADRYFGNVAGEFFKGDFALSEGEIEALAGGQSILEIGKSPDIYLPMVSAAETISDASGNGNDATRHGNPATITPHFIGTGGGGAVAAKTAHLRRMMQG